MSHEYNYLNADSLIAFPKREVDSHKNSVGRVLIIGSSPGMSGACILAQEAAFRCGAGVVVLAHPSSLANIMETSATECMTLSLPENSEGYITEAATGKLEVEIKRADSIVVGPGMGRHADSTKFIQALLPQLSNKAHLIDADALWHLAQLPKLLQASNPLQVLTPHLGELKALLKSVNLYSEASVTECIQLSSLYGGSLVRKGPGSLVIHSEQIYKNATGNPGMATAGSGDVLSGIIGSLLAKLGQQPTAEKCFQAACLGVHLHGLSGDFANLELGEESLMAGDLTRCISLAIQRYSE